MESRIRERFTQAIIDAAGARYEITPNQLELLDGFESFIFRFSRAGRSYVMRIGHSLRRSPDLIKGEIDFLAHLARGGAAVAGPIKSPAGRYVESIPDGHGDTFLVTAFDEAPGAHSRQTSWDGAFFQAYGRAIGRMHALSRTYSLPNAAWQRPHWDDDSMLSVHEWLPAADQAVVDRFSTLLTHLRGLPRDPAHYGLVHQDAHGGNFFVTPAGQFTFFDFDDCAYTWYMNDIAIVMFYAGFNAADTNRASFAARFVPPFLAGYEQETTLDRAWLAEVPNFLKLREIDLYAVIHRSVDLENLTDPWVAHYMDGRRERIIRNEPFIEFDTAAFSAG